MNSIIGVNSILGPVASDSNSNNNNNKSLPKDNHDDSPVFSPDMAVKEPILALVPNEVTGCSNIAGCDDKSLSKEDTTRVEVSFDCLPEDDNDDIEEAKDNACHKLSQPPLWSPNDFHLRQDNQPTSWSLYCLDKNVRAAGGGGGAAAADTDSLWFRLSRNDNPQNGVYLKGMDELLFSLDGILMTSGSGGGDVKKALVFYVHWATHWVRLRPCQVRAFVQRVLDPSFSNKHKQHQPSSVSPSNNSNNNNHSMATLVCHQQKHDDNAWIASFPSDHFGSMENDELVPNVNNSDDDDDDDDDDDEESETEPSSSSSLMMESIAVAVMTWTSGPSY